MEVAKLTRNTAPNLHIAKTIRFCTKHRLRLEANKHASFTSMSVNIAPHLDKISTVSVVVDATGIESRACTFPPQT